MTIDNYIIRAFAWRDWEKSRKTSIGILSFLAEIWTNNIRIRRCSTNHSTVAFGNIPSLSTYLWSTKVPDEFNCTTNGEQKQFQNIPDILTSSLLKTSHSEKNWSTLRLSVSTKSIPEVSGSWGGAPVTDMRTRAKTSASTGGEPMLHTPRTLCAHC